MREGRLYFYLMPLALEGPHPGQVIHTLGLAKGHRVHLCGDGLRQNELLLGTPVFFPLLLKLLFLLRDPEMRPPPTPVIGARSFRGSPVAA